MQFVSYGLYESPQRVASILAMDTTAQMKKKSLLIALLKELQIIMLFASFDNITRNYIRSRKSKITDFPTCSKISSVKKAVFTYHCLEK